MKSALLYLNPLRSIQSPVKGMVQLALGLSLGFLFVHLAGWRECTAFISGTVGTQQPTLTVCCGMLYLLFYFGFVLGVPILMLAALILAAGKYVARRKGRRTLHEQRDVEHSSQKDAGHISAA